MFVEYVVVLFCACLCRGEDTPTYENDVCCGYGMFGFRLMVFVEYAVVLFCACLCRGEDTPTYGMVVFSDMECCGYGGFGLMVFIFWEGVCVPYREIWDKKTHKACRSKSRACIIWSD